MTFTSRQVHFWSLDDLHSLRSKFSELTHGDRMFAIYKIALSRASWHFGHPTTPKWSYQFLVVKETDLVAFLNQPSRFHMLLTKLIDHLNPAILRARTPLILQQPAASFLSCPIDTSKDAKLPTKSRAQSSGWSVQLNSSFQYPKNGEQSHPEYFTFSCRQRWLQWSSTVWPRSLCSL